MTYMYEPFAHRVSKVSIKKVSQITGISESTLFQQRYKGQYNNKLNCFFTADKPNVKQKRILNQRIQDDHEIWKFNPEYQLYVSNMGRFKTKNGLFKFPNDIHGSLMIIHQHRYIKASDVVYETFIGNLKYNQHAYPKNSLYNDLHVNNLVAMSFEAYRKYRNNQGRSRAVYLIDNNNNIVEEYINTKEASKYLYMDRTKIAKRCNEKMIENGLMFMWKADYHEIEERIK